MRSRRGGVVDAMAKDVLVNALSNPNGTLTLFGRTGSFEIDYPDAFWIPAADAEKFPTEWAECIGDPDRGFRQVRWPEPLRGSRAGRLKYFYENLFAPRKITPLEADVAPARRFLIENPRVRMTSDWRLFWFDLETEMVADWSKPWRSRILSFSWHSSHLERGGHVRLREDSNAAERDLLREFVKLANQHDILLAWNGARFDNKVVEGRCVELNVEFDPFLYHWLDHLWLFKRYYQRSEDGGVKQSFALESIAAALLGSERKVPVKKLAAERGFDGGDVFRWVWENEPELLEEYNDQDVALMKKLEDKTGFIQLHLSICQLCRVLPTEGSLYPMTQVDGRMLQRGFETGYHFPSRIRTDDPAQKRARGAYVPEADVGLHESVAVLDFARMYPSIIQTFNMSLETLDPNGDLAVPETTPKGRPTGEVVARFRSAPEGHLPAALRGVLEYRQQYKKRMAAAEPASEAWFDAQRLSTACKILANIFYGVILAPFSRFHVHEIGESVTSFGRLLLSTTIRTAAAKGHPLVFGDTDSVAFVAGDAEAEAVRDDFNSRALPELLEPTGAKTGFIALEYEKRFRRIVVTASKRYAGKFALYDGKPVDEHAPFDVRGLEIVRSDVCAAARQLQRATIDKILDGAAAEKVWSAMRDIREDFIGGGTPVPELVLRKAMTKQPDEYATKPVQVKVAEQMAGRGMEVYVGSKIPFLITRGGPIIPEELDSAEDLDLSLYWNKYVFPPTRRVLDAAFPEIEWSDLNFERGHDPNQLTHFESGKPSPKRATRRGANGRSNGVEKKEQLGLGLDDQITGRPVRKVRRTKPKQEPAPDARPVRKVRRTKPKSPTLLLVVPEKIAEVAADRIADIVARFPGNHALRVDVEIPSTAVVELACPQRIASPVDEPKLSVLLRTLGIRWVLEAGR